MGLPAAPAQGTPQWRISVGKSWAAVPERLTEAAQKQKSWFFRPKGGRT